jgi:hypothetical protein
MKFSRLFSILLAGATLTLGIASASADEQTETAIKFSDPSKPGTFKVVLNNGDLHIRGSDDAEVKVASDVKAPAAPQREDGLRVLTSAASYSLTENGNVVTLSYGWPNSGGGGDFHVTVPRNTNIVIATSFGGDTSISGVNGDIEVKNLNGEVKLEDVAGGVLVETMNGEVDVGVRELHEGKPLSFTSMNGQIALHLPADLKANVRLRTHNGSILTDFEDRVLVTKTSAMSADGHHGSHGKNDVASGNGINAAEIRAAVRDAVRASVDAARAAGEAARKAIDEGGEDHDGDVPVPPVPPLPPMTGGKVVTGTLNGGGPEIQVTTMNGDVTLRKAEPKK